MLPGRSSSNHDPYFAIAAVAVAAAGSPSEDLVGSIRPAGEEGTVPGEDRTRPGAAEGIRIPGEGPGCSTVARPLCGFAFDILSRSTG